MSARDQADVSGLEATGGVFLDPESFRRLKDSRDPATFATAWLDTLSRIIADMHQGVVVLSATGGSKFEPAAIWPRGASGSPALMSATEGALKSGRLVLQMAKPSPGGTEGPMVAIGYPVTVNERIVGAAAVLVDQNDDEAVRLAMDQLEWGCGWLETIIRRKRVTGSGRLVTAVELLATSLHHERFQASATAVATELAGVLGCERVSIGFLRGQHARVRALSHSAAFGKKANLIRAIEAAMDEAIDQQAVVVLPPPPGGPEQVTRSHVDLRQNHGTGPILSVPLTEDRKVVGAMTLERPEGEPFDAETVQVCEQIATLLGPVLESKRREDRWLARKALDTLFQHLGNLIGRGHIGFKLATFGLLGLIVFLVFAEGDYRITADATLEGTVQRVVAAPIAGYLADAGFRAGDIVRQGQVMALLDDRDLWLERLKWVSQRAKQQREYSEAMAKHERAQTRILKTQIEQADAQIALLDEQLARLRIVAPFDGYIVSGDLSQALGAPVERGDVLFEVAPLSSYRIIFKVDERDIGDVALGLDGELVLNSMPDDRLDVVIEKVTPISTAEEGRNFFRVEASLRGGFTEKLRPGMEGVGKIYVERRRLIWIWTYKVVHWIRMFFWSWWP